MRSKYVVIHGEKQTRFDHDILIPRLKRKVESPSACLSIAGHGQPIPLTELADLPPSETTECFFDIGGQRHGPFLPAQLRSMCLQGTLPANTSIVWQDNTKTVAELLEHPLFLRHAETEGVEWPHVTYKFTGIVGGLTLGLTTGGLFSSHPLIVTGFLISGFLLGNVFGAIADNLNFVNRQLHGGLQAIPTNATACLTAQQAGELRSSLQKYKTQPSNSVT